MDILKIIFIILFVAILIYLICNNNENYHNTDGINLPSKVVDEIVEIDSEVEIPEELEMIIETKYKDLNTAEIISFAEVEKKSSPRTYYI